MNRVRGAPLSHRRASGASGNEPGSRTWKRHEYGDLGCAGRTTTMADDALQAEVERLRAENAALKARTTRGVSIKVSEKGGVSVYGLGRFPVTLYKEQWIKLLDMADELRA